MAPRVDVRALREKMGCSQEAFGEQFPVDKRTVRRWEAGTVDPSPMAHEKLHALHQQHMTSADAEPTASGPRRKALVLS